MVLGISSTKSSSSSTEAAEAYNRKQQQKIITRATVATLIGCCAGQEVVDGFPTDGVAEYNDNDSFVNPSSSTNGSFAGDSGSSRASSAKKTATTTPRKNDSFGSAIKKQQQRNRFTSSPLIERDSSLVRSESGLLSLLSSGTFVEASPSFNNGSGNGGKHVTSSNYNNTMNHHPIGMRRNQTPPTPSMMSSTPPRSAGRRKHSLQQLQHNTPPAASPAMELSMARQSANATLSSPQYQRSRSMQQKQHYVTAAPPPTTHNNSPVRSSVADTVAAMSIESPTKKARQDEDIDHHHGSHYKTSSIMQPTLDIEGSYSAAETIPSPSPQQKLPQKPTIVQQTSSFSSTEIMASSSEHKTNIVIWHHYTKATLDSHQEGHLHHSPQSLLWDKSDTNNSTTNNNNNITINEELDMSYKFPRMYLQDPTVLNVDFLNQGAAWWYRLQSGVESTLGHVRSENVKQHLQQQQQQQQGEFSPTVQPTNVWSEPHASTMKVRGPTYAQDGVKIPSEESMFAVLGVDNFVNEKDGSKNGGGKEEDCRSGTSSFRERWKSVCKDVGVESVPFLLVFNFIVPWGNFQMYMIRPDADNGPYSTHHADRPSEKAWKSFLEGDTEYRNTVLKFIPRIIAGPWMVKKMVGSTPALIGQKLPVSYSGSIEENYLEVSLDVTQGPALGNTIANTVAGKADVVTVDLGFVLEGHDADGTLPEQMLGLVRLHHFNMKKAFTHARWKDELRMRSQS